MFTIMQNIQNVRDKNNILQEKPLNIKVFSQKIKELREFMLKNDPHRFDNKEIYGNKRIK